MQSICKSSVSTLSGISRSAFQWFPAGLENLPSTCVSLQPVRWRKNRMSPINKNKQFIVPKLALYGLGESDEILRLTHKYATHVKSTRLYLRELYEKQSDTSEAAMLEAQEEERQHQEMMEYNRQENERMAAIRAVRVQGELNERLELIVINKMKIQAREGKEREEALVLLQETEELVKTFISLEDIASALEQAYDNPVDYNFAIDVQGFVYPGHSTKPWQVENKNRVTDPEHPTRGAICKMSSTSAGTS